MQALTALSVCGLLAYATASTNEMCQPEAEQFTLRHPKGRPIHVMKMVTCDAGPCQISFYIETPDGESAQAVGFAAQSKAGTGSDWEERQTCKCRSHCGTCDKRCHFINPTSLLLPASRAANPA